MKHINPVSITRCLPARADSLLVKQTRIDTVGSVVGVLGEVWALGLSIASAFKGGSSSS